MTTDHPRPAREGEQAGDQIDHLDIPAPARGRTGMRPRDDSPGYAGGAARPLCGAPRGIAHPRRPAHPLQGRCTATGRHKAPHGRGALIMGVKTLQRVGALGRAVEWVKMMYCLTLRRCSE